MEPGNQARKLQLMRINFEALPSPKTIIIWSLLLLLGWGLGGCQYLPIRPGESGKEEVRPSKSEAYYHYLQAQYYLLAEDAEAAAREYEEALKYDPNSAQMETDLAALYQRMVK